MALSQRGAISLPIVIAVVLGLGFVASAYLNFNQYQRAQQDKKLLNGEITDLRYQVKQDRLASADTSPSPSPEESESPSPSPSDSPTPAPATTPQVAGASTGSIKPCNVHPTAGNTSPYLVKYTQMTNPTPATIGERAGSYTKVTVMGKTGYVLTTCVNS